MEWISTKDRLPELDSRVLIYNPKTDLVSIATFHYGELPNEREMVLILEHMKYWMPIPEKPKGK